MTRITNVETPLEFYLPVYASKEPYLGSKKIFLHDLYNRSLAERAEYTSPWSTWIVPLTCHATENLDDIS